MKGSISCWQKLVYVSIKSTVRAVATCRTERLHATCLTRGTWADHRFAYFLGKNAIDEKVCRACRWCEWYRGEEDIHYTNGMGLAEAKQRFVSAGLEEAHVEMGEGEAIVLARKNGYELIELLQGERPREQLLVVCCMNYDRQPVLRIGDVGFGCTCFLPICSYVENPYACYEQEEDDMETLALEKPRRMDLRLTGSQRASYEEAAALKGQTLTQWSTSRLDESAADIEAGRHAVTARARGTAVVYASRCAGRVAASIR